MTQKKQRSLLNRGDEACRILKEHVDNGDVIRIISHNDADGLSAAGMIGKAISNRNGQFHISIISRLTDNFMKKLTNEKYQVFLFCDMGSANLPTLSHLHGNVIIADHHQPIDSKTNSNIIHVNPHLFGFDGSRELSASGAAYLIIRGMDKSLASFALVGAFGDMQYYNEFIGMNRFIMEEGIKNASVQTHEDLRIASRYDEPLYKALAYTFNPTLPGITANIEGSREFLEKIGLSYAIKFQELAAEEKDILKRELTKINPEIFGEVFTDKRLPPSIKYLSDFAKLLDACGKNKEYGLAIGICLGEEEKSLEKALNLQREYREDIIKGLEWIKRERPKKMENIQYIYTKEKTLKGVMGTIASISFSLELSDPNLPILALSRMDNQVKVSARATPQIIKKGVDLGRALRDASSNFGGAGGGHDIAAGAMIPYRELENFLRLVDNIIGSQKKES
ncbi:MAG: single-stranded-DNA-specific exonuclease [Methanobacteriaceae archaeon]|nr:single-stranded-DNA-specific exonuclease [Methanobacteriaceae archaeon]